MMKYKQVKHVSSVKDGWKLLEYYIFSTNHAIIMLVQAKQKQAYKH